MCCNHNMKRWWSTLENSTGGSFTHNQMSALSLPQFKIQCYASRWFPQALWTWVLVESKYLPRVDDGWAAKVSHISGSGCVREKKRTGTMLTLWPDSTDNIHFEGLYEAVSDQGPVWVQREPNFQGSRKVFFNDQICCNYYNMMYWERILQKNRLITCVCYAI